MRRTILCFVLLFLCALPATARADAILSLSDATLTDDGFSIDILISGVDDLYGFDIGLTNPSLLPVATVEEGEFLQSGGTTFFFPTPDGSSLLVTATLLFAVEGVSGSGTLATVDFVGDFADASLIDFDILRILLVDSSLSEISFSVASTTVPEPSSLILLGAGLTVLARYRRGAGRRAPPRSD